MVMVNPEVDNITELKSQHKDATVGVTYFRSMSLTSKNVSSH